MNWDWSIGLLQLSNSAYGICAVQLSFSLPKLVFLLAWFYSSLYIVQYLQGSYLMPKHNQLAINFLAIIFGPLVLGILYLANIIDSAKKGDKNLFEIFSQLAAGAKDSISLPRSVSHKHIKHLDLLSSSGRNMNEIYGKNSKNSNIVTYTKNIISNALLENASDIQIAPKDQDSYIIRFRIDGMLVNFDEIDSDIANGINNSIKAISSMDIAEKRRPQDGSFAATFDEETVSFRVASTGVLNGEKLSIRILRQDTDQFSFGNMGLSHKQVQTIMSSVNKPSGMILVCGPTGSGKTTTLYAVMNQIDKLSRNLITIEDPIEHILENASQIEINNKADITFANSLRSILRQDPDVICVGEIRDEETASIALRAAQTGHLVLATIHSNSNSDAMIRLLDLGVSPILIASGLSMVISQRLLRRLCDHCKEKAHFTQAQIVSLTQRGINHHNIHKAAGCEHCRNVGYNGRFAVFDILQITNEFKAKFSSNPSVINKMRNLGDKRGKSNLKKQAIKHIVATNTTVEELKRVIG